MKPLTDFLPGVLPLVPDCPIPLAVDAVRNAVIEFMGDTGLVEETIPVPLRAGIALYELPALDGRRLVRYLRGLVGQHAVVATAPATLDAETPSWRQQCDRVPSYAFLANGRLTVAPFPIEDAELSATFSCSIARGATTVDDVVLDDWYDGIVSGALARLMAMPNYKWSNGDLATYHTGQFRTAKDNAIIDRLKGGTTASLRVAPRPFGG